MKAEKKLGIGFVFIVMMISTQVYADFSSNELLLGAQPALTFEPFYESGEFDVNLLPAVVGVSLGQHWDLRLASVVNYHHGGLESGLEQVGMQLVIFSQVFSFSTMGNTYFGPCIGYSRWNLRDLHSSTVCGEGGVIILWPSQWELKAGLQFGSTYFSTPPDESDGNWASHFGVKISFGYWLTL